MKRTELTAYLDDLLSIDGIEDESPNGLQVEGKEEVRQVGFAVDYSLELAERAVADGLDLLFVHHGLIRTAIRRIDGLTLAYLKPLICSGISLYVAHLPLDVHPELSHNARMARLLQLESVRPLRDATGLPVGLTGELPGEVSRDELAGSIRRLISDQLQVLPFGEPRVKRVAIVSGRGASLSLQARAAGADFFLTGEPAHGYYHQIKALGLNAGFAGHYRTETWGVLAVMEHLQARNLVAGRFYDIPSPF